MFFNDEKGYALLLTLVVIIILSIILSAVLFSINNEIHITRFQVNRTNAFYLAEAGLEYAINIILNDKLEDGNIVEEDGDILPEKLDYLINLLTNNSSNSFERINIDTSNLEIGDTFDISSTANVNGISVNLNIDFSREIRELILNSAITSYGDVSVSNGAKVYGDIKIDEGTVNGDGKVTGDIVNINNFKSDYKLTPFPDNLIDDGEFIAISEEPNIISSDGQYDLIKAINAKITFDLVFGDIIIRTNKLDIQNGQIFLENVGDGQLKLYIEESFNLKGKFNMDGVPEDVTIYYGDDTRALDSTELDSTIYISEGSEFVGSIIAPNAKIVVNGGGRFKGSIICHSINLESGSAANYDDGASDSGLIIDGAYIYKVIWKENEGL